MVVLTMEAGLAELEDLKGDLVAELFHNQEKAFVVKEWNGVVVQ